MRFRGVLDDEGLECCEVGGGLKAFVAVGWLPVAGEEGLEGGLVDKDCVGEGGCWVVVSI